MTNPCDLSALEARRLIGRKALSPVELVDSCVERIGKVDGALNAITALDAEAASEAAKEAEQAVTAGEPLGLLHGLPVGIKDLQATKGLRTTWGSLLYKDHVPEEDDPVVANVRAEGAVILAKTNTPEFGAGANTTNRVFGATGNPFDPEKTCGGSSGGSGVAVATGMVPLATGSDHGGSLRTPATFCGVVGFRPSPGLVPRTTRPVALLPMPVLGPMARSVEDAHLLLRAQLDLDKDDPFSSDDVMRIPDALSGIDLGSLSVAFSTDLGCAPVDKDIAKVFATKKKLIGSFFAESQDRDPDLSDVHDTFEILRAVQFVAAHKERLENSRDLLGPNVIDNTERGLKYSLPDVAWAQKAQTDIYTRFRAFFDEADILICPAAGVSPFPHEQRYVEEINGEKMPTYMRWLAMTYGLTMALPSAVCLPCGTDHLGMPFGIQVVGPIGSDAFVLEVAYSLEQALAGSPETARPVPDFKALAKAAS
ncbi:MAG: amidase family protein [Hyphomicrobiales bacterium]|nr:amidase family protein [Hyphomicrobiales bacterium]